MVRRSESEAGKVVVGMEFEDEGSREQAQELLRELLGDAPRTASASLYPL